MPLPYEDELWSLCDIRQFRNEEALGSLALDSFTTPIIALGRGHIGMTRQALHGGDISARIQQVADVRSPHAIQIDIDTTNNSS